MRRLIFGALSLVFLSAASPPLEGVRRIVFLGDSNTYAGRYVEQVEAFLRASHPALRCEFLNLGLPSETVSGLSEPGHAGGQFPRPDLHERLQRVLSRTKPDLVVACYGTNDGIYYPFGPERFAKYQAGIEWLSAQAAAAGAKVLLVTPPVFDPEPIRARTLPAGRAEYREPFEGYDDVLRRYAAWLVSQRARGWDVVDAHTPMKQYLVEARRHDPGYVLAGDGVHFNDTGHWIIARELLRHWGVPDRDLTAPTAQKALDALPHGRDLLRFVEVRQRLLKDAWLTATGHTRPGMAKGLPLDQAEHLAGAIEANIQALLAAKP